MRNPSRVRAQALDGEEFRISSHGQEPTIMLLVTPERNRRPRSGLRPCGRDGRGGLGCTGSFTLFFSLWASLRSSIGWFGGDVRGARDYGRNHSPPCGNRCFSLTSHSSERCQTLRKNDSDRLLKSSWTRSFGSPASRPRSIVPSGTWRSSAAILIFGFHDWEYHRLGEVLFVYPRFGEEYQTTGSPDENVLGMVGWGQLRGVMILSAAFFVR